MLTEEVSEGGLDFGLSFSWPGRTLHFHFQYGLKFHFSLIVLILGLLSISN